MNAGYCLPYNRIVRVDGLGFVGQGWEEKKKEDFVISLLCPDGAEV